MLFLPLLLVGILLYMAGHRVWSLMIFFFFLSDGFQLVPLTLFETSFGFTKPQDFALFYIFILFAWGCLFYHNYIPRNKMTFRIALYLFTVFVLILISKYSYGTGWGDIIRTSRMYFFVLAYYVFRRVEPEKINKVMKILCVILSVLCVLFILQAITGVALLTGAEDHKASSGFLSRFYNMPVMVYFFAFYALFANPYKNKYGYLMAFLFVVTVFVPMHRGWSIVFICLLMLGMYYKMGGFVRFVKYLPILAVIFVPLVLLLVAQVSARTLTDLQSVNSGEYIDIVEGDDFEMTNESTFLFRAAHFFERYTYAMETPQNALFGLGLMAEDSDYTNNKFNFYIGLDDDKTGRIIQLETSDIAWSNFIVRYGLVGSFVYLFLYLSIMYSYFKQRKNRLNLSLFLYMLLLLGVSITSNNLYLVSSLIFPLMFFDNRINTDEESNSSNLPV